MIGFSFYKEEDINHEVLIDYIYSAIDILWVSDTDSVLIEMFYPRKDKIRSVRIFNLNSGYRIEIALYEIDAVCIGLYTMSGASKDMVTMVLNEVLLEKHFDDFSGWRDDSSVITTKEKKKKR